MTTTKKGEDARRSSEEAEVEKALQHLWVMMAGPKRLTREEQAWCADVLVPYAMREKGRRARYAALEAATREREDEVAKVALHYFEEAEDALRSEKNPEEGRRYAHAMVIRGYSEMKTVIENGEKEAGDR